MRAILHRIPMLLTTVTCLALLVRGAAAQADGSIKGAVVSREDRRPIADARVSVVGTSRGATTNQSGAYEITGIPARVWWDVK
jgi:hypothetical protein